MKNFLLYSNKCNHKNPYQKEIAFINHLLKSHSSASFSYGIFSFWMKIYYFT